MTTGEKIKHFRINANLTQKQLGDKCNMADSAIRKYESGKLNPKLETVAKFSKALNVHIEDILCLESFETGAERDAIDFGETDNEAVPVLHRMSEEGQKEWIKRGIEMLNTPEYKKHRT